MKLKYDYTLLDKKYSSVMNGELKESDYKKIVNDKRFILKDEWNTQQKDCVVYSELYNITINDELYHLFIGIEREIKNV